MIVFEIVFPIIVLLIIILMPEWLLKFNKNELVKIREISGENFFK